ncbi:MAG: glycosyltransferase involved in cell wall biosynthesis [Granulosicoccus sp.]|jgi:glycosyltransferase involved in cell wall biosynthesis
MKRVLILAYDFPPFNSIGGQRPYSWYRYFKEFDIEPIVVTRHWDIDIKGPEDCYLPSDCRNVTTEETEYGTIIRAPFTPLLRDNLIKEKGKILSVLRKGLTVWQMMTEHSLPSSDARNSIYLAAKNYLKENKVDAIVATGEPFILFTHAYRLSKEFKTPWIADYRDGWSTNYHMSESRLQRWIQQRIHLPIEQKMVATAALITTAAPSFAKEISVLLEGKKVDVIYNGFFEEKFKDLKNISPKRKFTIAHAGTVYPFQKVETMMEGLRSFLQDHPKKEIELIFYGLNFQPDQLQRLKLLSKALPIAFTDRMAHDEMLQELASCQGLLLLATPDKHQIYAKVFDYMALQKPILLVENDKGPLAEMLGNSHFICDDAMAVHKALIQLLNSNQEQKESTANPVYTRRHQTELLARLILDQ